jgi:hypothetical protein
MPQVSVIDFFTFLREKRVDVTGINGDAVAAW